MNWRNTHGRRRRWGKSAFKLSQQAAQIITAAVRKKVRQGSIERRQIGFLSPRNGVLGERTPRETSRSLEINQADFVVVTA
jgi:hypothetical protein